MSKICLIIGHGGNDVGAFNKSTKETELNYNRDLASKLQKELTDKGFLVDIYNRGFNKSENVDYLNKVGYDVLISLHCNAYNGIATGTEVLYWNTSRKGKELSQYLLDNIVKALGLKNRGLKPIKNGDRGAYLLGKTKPVCVLLEPFFIDNDDDLKVGNEKKNDYIKAVVDSCITYFKK